MHGNLLDETLAALVPPVAHRKPAEGAFNPGHCMGIYVPRASAGETLREYPAMLVGEAVANLGTGCTLLEGIPTKPPGGCVIMGTWEQLQAAAPALLEGLEAPAPGGYAIRVGRYAVAAGADYAGLVCAAHTLAQAMAMCPAETLPGCVLNDAPAFPVRSLLYDLRTHKPKLDHLLHLLGSLSAFKANRLHLLLSAKRPLAREAAPGSLYFDDAFTLAQAAGEYAIDVIPWFDLAGEFASGVRPAQAAKLARQAVEGLGCGAVGVASEFAAEPEAEGLGRFREFMEKLQAGGKATVYAPARLYATLPAELRAAAVPVAFGGGESVPSGAGAAVFQKSLAAGFVPPSPAEFDAALDRTLAAALAAGASELGFYADALTEGHVWENDLVNTMTLFSLAWRGEGGAREERERFCLMAYGEEGCAPALRSAEALAAAFPAALRDRGCAAQALAFGGEGGAGAAHEVDALELHRDEGLRQAREALEQARSAASHNAHTLEHAGLGLEALTLLRRRRELLEQARKHYDEAWGGAEGGLALCRAALRELLAECGGLAGRLRTLASENGECALEFARLEKFSARLAELDRAVAAIGPYDQVPRPEEIGFPAC